MSAGNAASKTRRAYKFIDAHRDEYNVQMMSSARGGQSRLLRMAGASRFVSSTGGRATASADSCVVYR